MQLIEIALAPVRGRKAQPGDEGEQHDENDECSPIDFCHGIPPENSNSCVCGPAMTRAAAQRRANYSLVAK
jgi:hypothetical protein